MAMTSVMRWSLEQLGLRPAQIQIVDHMNLSVPAATLFYNETNASPRVNALFRGLENEFAAQGGPGRKYHGLLGTIAREVAEDGRGNDGIIDKLEADLRRNPQLSSRIATAIRNNPNGVATMISQYDNGTITLADGLAQIERGYAAPAGGRRVDPQRGGGSPQPQAITAEEIRRFNANPNVTDNEQEYFRRLRERNARGGRSADEIREERRLYNRLDDRGEQLTRAQIGTLPGQGEPRVDRRDDPPAEGPAVLPQEGAPVETAAPVEANSGTLSLPDQITGQDYDDLKGVLIEGIRSGMPEFAENGLLAGFEARLSDPAFKQQFMDQYNNDPVFRSRFQNAFSNLAEIGMAGSASSEGVMGFFGNMLGANEIRGRITGNIREFLTHPEYLLSADRLENLRQVTEPAANRGATFMHSIGRMFGFDGPADWSQFLNGIKQFFQNLFSGNGGGFDVANLGFAGNGGGLAGLMGGDGPLGGLMSMFTGGGADAGAGDAAAGPQLATVDPNRVAQPPGGPSLGQHGPGGPVGTG